MIKLIATLLFLTIGISQNWKPIHNIESYNHHNDIINYHITDSLSNELLINNSNRNNLSHEVIGYLPYWEYNHYPNLNYNLLTQINYFSCDLDQYGNILNTHNWENTNLVNYAHEHGVKVKLCATLFGQNNLSTLLSNQDNRENAIQNLLSLVLLKNADGIDIDFELLPSSQRNNLVLFMEELSTAFHAAINDPIITMATPAIDWSNAWDYNQLAEITDGLFIMGYNYFYSGSSSAGPVSPLGGFYYDLEYTVSDYIDKTGGQYDKLILGLPYYGYDWPVEDSLIFSETNGTGQAITYDALLTNLSDYNTSWHNATTSNWLSYNNNVWKQVWYDDSLSLSNKYEFAINNNLQGIGIWALGYEGNRNELWGAINDKFSEILIGDLNNDQIINILDVILLTNIILEIDNDMNYSDINGDNSTNILDIIYLVNIILAS